MIQTAENFSWQHLSMTLNGFGCVLLLALLLAAAACDATAAFVDTRGAADALATCESAGTDLYGLIYCAANGAPGAKQKLVRMIATTAVTAADMRCKDDGLLHAFWQVLRERPLHLMGGKPNFYKRSIL